ncbi:hypothetical protein Tco_1475813 [Tanacetum coccineum]
MQTRSQTRNNQNHPQQQAPPVVEPFNLEEPIENPAPPLAPMDDTRTMAQLLEAPTEGYEDAIVVPEITADNFELKHGLLNLVQNKQFFGHDKEDPHAHIRHFNKSLLTMKFPTSRLKDMVKALLLDKKNQSPAPTPVKAVEESCVTCDFEPDPRVPLILGRCFLKTSHALIDVYEGEITLRVGREAITFNLDQTSRYTANFNHMTANRIDVIDMACEEYS